jgi:hypothetical protein
MAGNALSPPALPPDRAGSGDVTDASIKLLPPFAVIDTSLAGFPPSEQRDQFVMCGI